MFPRLAKCFSFTASRDWLYRQSFSAAGLRAAVTDFGDGTVMHCWVPKIHDTTKPSLVLIHGFGANAMWQYGDHLRNFVGNFNVYVPDLLFFGESYSSRPERTESFQAVCLRKLMDYHDVQRMSMVGISYGGFVAYSFAAQFPDDVEKLTLCCTGVCLEEIDMKNGLFKVSDLDEAASILMPQTPEKLRELMRMSFVRPARGVPSWFLADFIDIMCTNCIEEKKGLLEAILKGRKLSNLPKIQQKNIGYLYFLKMNDLNTSQHCVMLDGAANANRMGRARSDIPSGVRAQIKKAYRWKCSNCGDQECRACSEPREVQRVFQALEVLPRWSQVMCFLTLT
ncbi:hypothetical protein PIB30_010760 [Stylosanthes scabra]|uniref:AB hydrolase-1 domain-containing protein n=1 Tax=Stylosanthes scabra TaxID=79078 RepID=A0ABU6Y536_9FABA|nr:hypothetical protein [Stylosanthes scabra]